ncbi:hypothetical protein DPMN_055545 [Dreissena polymorpha]|uniref:Uncharacterized protein n=1 Tax=Dreissena polymorpha TaxID=45954 RepID=A0A9D4CQ62_DREPO|nr:hypothetical protein DPMN_055545 [Dreissena polymorpha]
MSVFQSLEPKECPYDLTELKSFDGGKCFKSPVPDLTTGLDLSKHPGLDPDISKLSLIMPVSSAPTSVPYSMLEYWELREHRSIGIANQLDLMAATALEMDWELSDSVPEELRALFLHLSQMTQFLSHNSASSMSEMLRIRRDLTSLPCLKICCWNQA